jgi:hypothetical protein
VHSYILLLLKPQGVVESNRQIFSIAHAIISVKIERFMVVATRATHHMPYGIHS